jgi:hypothetical protein
MGCGRPAHEAGAARRATVTESGRPLQAAVTGSRYRKRTDGGDVSGRYRKRAAVTGGRYRKRRYRRPLQEAGGGRDGGLYLNNALRQAASTLPPG